MMQERAAYQRVRDVVAERIRMLRQAKKLSQEELADLAGCHRTYVGMIERGEGNPSLRVLVSIAEALEVDLTDLLHPSIPNAVAPTTRA